MRETSAPSPVGCDIALVPKISISNITGGGDEIDPPIGTWVAAGLSLAVIGWACQLGVFTADGVAPAVTVAVKTTRLRQV